MSPFQIISRTFLKSRGQLKVNARSTIWQSSLNSTIAPFSTTTDSDGVSLSGTRFGRVLLTVRGAEGVANSVHFFQLGLGLTVIRHTDEWAELACLVGKSTNTSKVEASSSNSNPAFRLNLKGVYNEAELSVGYGPILCFEVEDMDTTIARCIQMGANLDGPIQYPAHGKVATIRAPDGHMVGLYEPALM